jgi:hypothetical protein
MVLHSSATHLSILTEMTKYNEYKKLDFPAFEDEILKFWNEQKIFDKSVTNRNRGKIVRVLRRTAKRQRYAWYSPRNEPYR